MIYAKIFLDENGCVVFDSTHQRIGTVCRPRGEWIDENGDKHYETYTTIFAACCAISVEAISVLKNTLCFRNEKFDTSKVEGDFEFIYTRFYEGYVGFIPSVEKTSKILNPNDYILVNSCFGFNLNVTNDMIKMDNDFLSKLDLKEPFDENILLDSLPLTEVEQKVLELLKDQNFEDYRICEVVHLSRYSIDRIEKKLIRKGYL